MERTDEQLMLAYQGGDMAAFDALYERYRAPLFRFVTRQAGSLADSEALYQDVWAKMIHARSQWDPQRAFRPWLYSIASNHLIDHLRAVKHRDSTSQDETAESADQPRRLPDALLLIADCIERLRHLLSALPEVQRSAFLLKEEGGLTLAEIASCTGVGRETVKSRLRYALKSLRRGLEGCDD